jgi:hypothetical protein
MPIHLPLCALVKVLLLCLFVHPLLFFQASLRMQSTEPSHTEPRQVEGKDLSYREKQPLMIIAAHPTSLRRYAVIWSHLKCLSSGFHKIVISTSPTFEFEVNNFLDIAKSSLPEIKAKIVETRFISNDRYDFRLWCGALNLKNLIIKAQLPSRAPKNVRTGTPS